MKDIKIPELHFGDFENEFKWLLSGMVKDLKDPKFNEEVQALSRDAIRLTTMRLRGVDEDLLKRGKAAVDARIKAIAGIPGLIASSQTDQFITYAGKVVSMLVDFGIASVTGYIGHLSLSGMTLIPKNEQQ